MISFIKDSYVKVGADTNLYLDGFAYAGLLQLQTVDPNWPQTAGLNTEHLGVRDCLARSAVAYKWLNSTNLEDLNRKCPLADNAIYSSKTKLWKATRQVIISLSVSKWSKLEQSTSASTKGTVRLWLNRKLSISTKKQLTCWVESFQMNHCSQSTRTQMRLRLPMTFSKNRSRNWPQKTLRSCKVSYQTASCGTYLFKAFKSCKVCKSPQKKVSRSYFSPMKSFLHYWTT